jgi:hypothetical protein
MSYSAEKTVQISEKSGDFLRQLDDCIQWVEKYLKAEERVSERYKLIKIRREMKKIRYSVLQKPAAALYGESQVGKSYLIKNLLSVPQKELEIKDVSTGILHDFLEKINPKGDQTEATSVVTRFSADSHHIDTAYPVAIRLLSPKDIVLFLCDSYYSDISDHKYNPRPEVLEEEIRRICKEAAESSVQHYLCEDDIYDIREYLEENYGINTYKFEEASFWSVLAQSIHKIQPNNWHRVFELIWGKLSAFNDIFKKLIRQLEILQFSVTVYAEFRSVLRQYGTILHVARLREIELGPLYEDVSKEDFVPDVAVMFQNENGRTELRVNKSNLCALSAELILPVSSELKIQKPFLANSDLLDFPGARSRLENREEAVTKEQIDMMVLRGKVSYIFNKYSSERLISNLMLCNKDAKIEVKYIPKLLDKWIGYYIGKTAEERERSLRNTSIPPIFVIFTFFNNDLKFNEKNDRSNNLHEKWIKRFQTIFENEIVTKNFDWHNHWTRSQPFFQNFYMLRDFTHSRDTYFGYSENKDESDWAKGVYFGDKFQGHEDYFDKLRDSFLQFEFVKKHFSNAVLSWEEAASRNKDGSDLIIKNLTEVSSNETRIKRFTDLLCEYVNDVRDILAKHYHSNEADKQIVQAARTGADIHANMNTIFSKNPYHFGRFIQTFMVPERDIYNFYHEKLASLELIENNNLNKYIFFRESSPALSNNKSYDENIEVLRATYHLKDKEEVETYFQEKEIDLKELFYGELNSLKNNSVALAEGLRDYWFANYLGIERFRVFIDDGFSQSAVERLLDTTKVNFDRQKITRIIADKIKKYVDRYDKIIHAEELIADVSAAIINEFVNTLGWSFYSENEVEKIGETNQANGLNLVLPAPDVSFEAMTMDDLNLLFVDIDKLNENISKSPPDENAIKNVPVIRQYRRWRDLMKVSFIATCDIPTYDVEGNRNLGTLIDSVSSFQFEYN